MSRFGSTAPGSDRLLDRLSRRGAVIALLGLYFGYHAAFRILSSPALGRDDLIEAVLAQSWAWGYNPGQPPLYTWLVVAATGLLGPGIAAHAVVKFGLLFAGYTLFHLAAERAIGQARLAALATASLLLIYMLAFDALHLYTHSVALVPFSAATLYAVLRLREGAGAWAYAGLGAAVGGGLLAKYGFPVFVGSLLLAGLGDPELRRRILDRRMLLALALAAALFLPHAAWMALSPHDVRESFEASMRVGTKPGWLAGMGAGVAAFASASFNFLLPFILVALAIFTRAFLPGSAAGPHRATRRLFERWFLIEAGVVLAGVVAAGVSGMANHHLLALWLPVPIYVFLRLRDVPVPAWRENAYAGVVALATLGAAGAIGYRAFSEPSWCSRCYLHWDYAAIAGQLRAAGFSGGTIVAEDHHVGGNLRTEFPGTAVFTARWPLYSPRPPASGGSGGQCLVAWDAERRGRAMPDELAAMMARRFGADAGAAPAPAEASAALFRSARKTLRVGYVLWKEGAGSCR